jgi:hypothetical protein
LCQPTIAAKTKTGREWGTVDHVRNYGKLGSAATLTAGAGSARAINAASRNAPDVTHSAALIPELDAPIA